MRKNHFLLMALCCLAPIILVVGFLSLFKGSSNSWFWLIVLLCPLLHIIIMRGHKHGEVSKLLYKCPECGFEYEEKEWAKKCEAWCREDHTCNLEIIKHAIKKQI